MWRISRVHLLTIDCAFSGTVCRFLFCILGFKRRIVPGASVADKNKALGSASNSGASLIQKFRFRAPLEAEFVSIKLYIYGVVILDFLVRRLLVVCGWLHVLSVYILTVLPPTSFIDRGSHSRGEKHSFKYCKRLKFRGLQLSWFDEKIHFVGVIFEDRLNLTKLSIVRWSRNKRSSRNQSAVAKTTMDQARLMQSGKISYSLY